MADLLPWGLEGRRALLRAGVCLGLGLPAAGRAQQHVLPGPVEPRRAAPALALTLHNGQAAWLSDLLRGQITALQLMFTGCSGTCPIQGAIFAALQDRLVRELPQTQLLSLSIAPLNDDAKALAAWLKRHGAGSRWLAGVPAVKDGEVMLDFLAGRRNRASPSDPHTPQVYLFDREGRLAYRMAELASPQAILRIMAEMSRTG
jgi:protein SCO1